MRHSFQVELLQVIFEERIFDSFEDDTDVVRVCGAGVVPVKLFGVSTVMLLVHLEDVLLRSIGVTLRPCGQSQRESEQSVVFITCFFGIKS